VNRGRCAEHAPPAEAESHRFGRAIYNDRRWRGRYGLRLQVLTEQPFCACGRVAETVDHILPHRGDERLAFDRGNLRSLCASCHSRRHAPGGKPLLEAKDSPNTAPGLGRQACGKRISRG
jgi:5-methylcytosine-specific restriction protein A